MLKDIKSITTELFRDRLNDKDVERRAQLLKKTLRHYIALGMKKLEDCSMDKSIKSFLNGNLQVNNLIYNFTNNPQIEDITVDNLNIYKSAYINLFGEEYSFEEEDLEPVNETCS